jgi:poly(3-hydroxybutyrate) depolymerase
VDTFMSLTIAAKLHVVLEGCLQNEDKIGDQFYTHAGYNEWAESNNIIILYPQVKSGPGNPNECWDWWGYTNSIITRGTASR